MSGHINVFPVNQRIYIQLWNGEPTMFFIRWNMVHRELIESHLFYHNYPFHVWLQRTPVSQRVFVPRAVFFHALNTHFFRSDDKDMICDILEINSTLFTTLWAVHCCFYRTDKNP